jgi:hypothetical protein
LNVTGLTNLNNLVSTNTTSTNLNVTGLVSTNTTSTNLNVTGLTNLNNLVSTNTTSTNLNVTGLTNLNKLVSTSITSTNLNVTGLASIGNLTVSAETVSSLRILSNATIVYSGAPPAPANSTEQILYIDSADSLLKSKQSTGILTTYNPLTTKGDLMTHTGTTQVRQAVGTDGQVLKADSSSANGVTWTSLYSTDVSKNSQNGYFSANNATSVTISQSSFTAIPFDTFNFNNSNYFSLDSTSSVVSLLSTGTYLLDCFLVFSMDNSNTTTALCKFQIDTTGGGTFTDIVGTTVASPMVANVQANGNHVRGTNTSVQLFAILKITSTTTSVRVVCTQTGSTQPNLTTLSGLSNLTFTRVNIDLSDNSYFYNGYTTSTTTLGSSLIDLPLTKRFTDSGFTSTDGTGSVTIVTSGKYLLSAAISFEKSTLTDNYAIGQAVLVVNGSVVSDTISYTGLANNGNTSNNNNNTTTNNLSTTNISRILVLSAGDVVKIQAKISGGSNLRLSSGTSCLCIVKFQSSGSSQATPRFFDAYNTGGLSLNNNYQDIPLNTEVIKDSVFSHTSNAPEVVVGEIGFYIARCSVNVSNTDNKESQINSKLVSSVNGTFYDASLSQAYSVVLDGTNLNQVGCFFETLIFVQPGTILKLQVVNASNNGILATINGSRLQLLKLDSVSSPSSGIIIFGNSFSFIEDPSSSSTSSTTYLIKLTLITQYLQAGYYNISCSYRITSLNNRIAEIYVTVDDSIVISDSIQTLTTNNCATVYNDFRVVFLPAGYHNVIMKYRSYSGSVISIDTTRLMIYRVN